MLLFVIPLITLGLSIIALDIGEKLNKFTTLIPITLSIVVFYILFTEIPKYKIIVDCNAPKTVACLIK